MNKEQYNAIVNEIVNIIKSKNITYTQAEQILQSAIRDLGNVQINFDSLKVER